MCPIRTFCDRSDYSSNIWQYILSGTVQNRIYFLVKKVRLASTTTPGEGYIEVLEVSKPNTWKRLCVEDLKDDEKAVVCRTLGYSGLKQGQSSVGSGQGLEGSDEVRVLHANIYCNSQENNVSSCCLEKGKSEESSCTTMAHVSCEFTLKPP